MEIETNSLQIAMIGAGGKQGEKNHCLKSWEIQSKRLSVILAGKSEKNKKHIVTVQMRSRWSGETEWKLQQCDKRETQIHLVLEGREQEAQKASSRVASKLIFAVILSYDFRRKWCMPFYIFWLCLLRITVRFFLASDLVLFEHMAEL